MVSIKLVRKATGTVVTKTEVSVWEGGFYKSTTDEQGIAHFEHVSPGRRSVGAEGKDLGEHELAGVTVVYI